MSVFKNYANYYDLLYKDKNYQKEVEYVNSLIRNYLPSAKTVLNLGCGTGKHDFIFNNQFGYKVTGVDLSSEMISIANDLITDDNKNSLKFFEGDIRKIDLSQKFDVVISLFHVMSYQITNDDILATFKTASKHLQQGGVFIFDCWYGPAVLTDRPSVRVKRLENDDIKILRISEPNMFASENVVDVNFELIIEDKNNNEKFETIKELHRMRYLFEPEINLFAQINNFKILKSEEWLSGNSLNYNTWNACFIAKKI